MSDIVDLGASKLDERTNALLVQCKAAPMGVSPDEAPDFGDTPMLGHVGVTCRPWPKDARGAAQGVIDESLPGTNGWCTAAWDPRCSSVVAELGPGESALHSTGPDFDSRFFAKDQLAAIVVGDDCAVVMDRKNKKFSISCFGCHFEMSEENGIVLSQGGVMIQLKDLISLMAPQTVIGGRVPTFPVGMVNPASLPAPTPAPGVFIGA
jgi:hypothetical protein